MKNALLIAALLLLTARLVAQTPAPAPKPDLKELGKQYMAWLYAGEIDRLWERFSPKMREAVGSADRLRALAGQLTSQFGTESAVLEEKVEPGGDLQVYVRTARFSKDPRTVTARIVVDAGGTIQGFLIRPEQKEAPSKYLDYQTKTPLHLPFTGEWLVVWGGRTVSENYHAIATDQRFAYDLLILRDGSTHTGDGSAVEQYFCFGQPILAPAAGTVAATVDGLPDNKPGVMDPGHPPGNHVVIDHGNGEFSFLAHLQKGSVKVKPGDKVKTGDPLGLCGNSGNTTEPHLHYHLQTTAEFGKGEGLPAQFLDYVADGQPVPRGEPRKGQRIRAK